MEHPPETVPAPDQADLAVLDAPILGRGTLTLFLLDLADAGAFDPVWSDQIHADWARESLRLNPDLSPERIRRRRLALDRAFPVANVVASRDVLDEVLAHCTTAAERKTAHVLATALSARAAVIVSGAGFCLTAVMAKLWHDVAVLSPDAWCLDLFDRCPDAVLVGAAAHRARTGGGWEDWLAALAPLLPQTTARLGETRPARPAATHPARPTTTRPARPTATRDDL